MGSFLQASKRMHSWRWLILLTLVGLTLWQSTRHSATTLAQEIPTNTPTKVIRLVAEIIYPSQGDVIAGVTPIIGTAVIENFVRYDIHIAKADSEDWRWVGSGQSFVSEGDLYLLDTTQFPDGFYDLRLRAVRADGNYYEDIVRGIEIRNTNPPTPTPLLDAAGTPLPRPTVTATPTPTPEFISYIPNGPGIFEPKNGDILRGVTAVVATANGLPQRAFLRFELAISPTGYAEWQLLKVSEEQYWQNTIYELDTRQWPDGLYDLRLRIIYADSNYNEFEARNLYIANYTPVRIPTATPTPVQVAILRPQPNANISGIVDFVGAANTPNFAQWSLYWRPSGAEVWTLLVTSDTPVPAFGLLARLDLAQLPVGAYDFRLEVVDQDGHATSFIIPQLRVLRQPPLATPTPLPAG
ncbi:MAG: hypothetical protein R3C14_01715 [Caldilineaceae bacterium]